jgi:hypothetical protein
LHAGSAHPARVGASLRVLGTLEREAGLDHLREAVGVLSDSPARLEHAKALAALGAALRRSGCRSEAREPLGQALDLADAAAPRPWPRRRGSSSTLPDVVGTRPSRTGDAGATPLAG